MEPRPPADPPLPAGDLPLAGGAASLAEMIYASSEAFEFALGLDSSKPEAYLRRAQSLRRLRQFDKAQALLADGLARHRNDVGLLREQIVLDCAQQNFAKAIARLEEFGANPPLQALADELKLAVLCAQRRFGPAEQIAKYAVTRFPQNAGVLAEVAYFHYHQDRFEQANEYFDRALVADPNDESALQWKIATLRRLGRFAEASTLLNHLIARFPKNAGLRLERGLLHFDQEQFAEAIGAFDEALLRERGNEDALRWKIAALRLEQRFSEADRLINESLARYPQSIAILLERACWFFDQQQYASAVAAFDAVLAIDAANEDAQEWKSVARQRR